MNVIVANERKDDLVLLNIDVIKRIEGSYSVDELIGMFTNFFFNKIVIDITSISDYKNYSVLKKLFESLDVNKIIILLNDSLIQDKEYVSDLISFGVYNFGASIQELLDMYNNPRMYESVSNLHISKTVYDINEKIDKEKGLIKEEFTFKDFTTPDEYDGETRKIIGVKNLTEHAGATTLVVQMVKQLNLKYKAIGIEMAKQDFLYFKTPQLYSCTSTQEVLKKIREHDDINVVVVDLNGCDYEEFCTDVIYLIEPGILRLGKLLKRNSKIFEDLSGQKIVLNRTGIKDSQITEFEVETNCKIFCVVSNFRDSIDRVLTVDNLLSKLGFVECLDQEKKDDSTTQQSVNKKGLFGKFF